MRSEIFYVPCVCPKKMIGIRCNTRMNSRGSVEPTWENICLHNKVWREFWGRLCDQLITLPNLYDLFTLNSFKWVCDEWKHFEKLSREGDDGVLTWRTCLFFSCIVFKCHHIVSIMYTLWVLRSAPYWHPAVTCRAQIQVCQRLRHELAACIVNCLHHQNTQSFNILKQKCPFKCKVSDYLWILDVLKFNLTLQCIEM